MERTQKQRVKDLVVMLGMSTRQFEGVIGASYGSIAHMGDKISGSLLDKIVTALPNVSMVWILTGQGDPIVDGEQTINNSFATNGAAASVFGDATVQSAEVEVLRAENARLKAEVEELKAEKAKLYELLLSLKK